jgi:hypothetical protein
MKVSERTINALAKVATGDPIKDKEGIAPYGSGPNLVRFFNEFGANHVYGRGFPSRWQFAEEAIREHNGSATLAKVIEALLDPRRFLNTTYTADAAAEYLNQYLRYDGYEACNVGGIHRVRDSSGATVVVESPSFGPLSHPFIDEQLEKCDAKIASSDYEGAVTNARTLVEAVLQAIEKELSGSQQPYDGELPRLYKRVQKLLNLDPDRKDIAEHLRTVLGGLASIVHGLAPLRNKMSDAHPAVFRPGKHHAKLTVNAAKTLVDFLFDSYEYQKTRGLLKPAGRSAPEATP